MYEINDTKTILEYPVTVEEGKTHIGAIEEELTDVSTYISTMFQAITKEAEAVFEADIAYTQHETKLYNFSGNQIKIAEGNFNELIAIVTDASVEITYKNIFPYQTYFVIDLSTSISSDPLTVQYYTGFEQSECPENFKLAIKMRFKDYFDTQRGSMHSWTLNDTKAFERLIMAYRS